MKDSETVGKFEDGMAELLGYNPVWYWMIVFIVLSILILTLFFILRLRSKDNNQKTKVSKIDPSFEFAGEIDKAFLMVANRAISTQEACQRVSIVLREYLHVRTGLPAGTMTITDLINAQAPVRVIDSIKYLYPIVFGDKQVATYDEFVQFMNSSRAVIDGKWN